MKRSCVIRAPLPRAYLRGVEIRTSWLRDAQPLDSSIRWWSRAKVPGFSVFQNIRAHARMKWSWNSRW